MMAITEQIKPSMWIGRLQVQVMNSMFYLNLISMAMMVLTFWYTAGYQIKDRYAPWFNLWEFVGIVVIAFMVLMYVDYKFILPSRMAFTNEQACKHENPAMDELRAIRQEIKELRELIAK